MDLRIRIKQARLGHDRKFYDYLGHGSAVFQTLVDEFGVIWELNEFPHYKMHPFSDSCEPVIAAYDRDEDGLLIERRQDIYDYLLDVQLREAREHRRS